MSNTNGRDAPWPFRPTFPTEPVGAEGRAAWERDVADLLAMYEHLKRSSNRSEAMRRFMLAGWRLAKGARVRDAGGAAAVAGTPEASTPSAASPIDAKRPAQPVDADELDPGWDSQG